MLNCNTYDKPNFKYTENLHDMEASGFFSSAGKLTYLELIQTLKIISDNKNMHVDFKKKEKISELIKININKIEILIKKLQDLQLNVI